MCKFERVCIECNNTDILVRKPRSNTCKPCSNKLKGALQKDLTKTTCPKCNSSKSYRATVCKECIDQSGENNPMYGKKLADNHPLVLKNKAISEDATLHHNYKHGEYIDNRNSNAFTNWAKEVREVFNNTCDCCGYSRKIALKAHHLYSYEKNKDIALEVENGVSLCANCHEEFHKEYGYGDNTKEQYITFKGVYNG
jgi:ribosomal protein L40E